MQRFVNRAAIERASAEVFSSAHARSWLMGVMAACLAAASGAALAAIWLGAVLLVEEGRRAFAARLGVLSPRRAETARLLLDAACAASLAIAPALVWRAQTELSAVLAAMMLAVLAIAAAFAGTSRRRTLIVSAPYLALALFFFIETAAAGLAAPAAAIVLAAVYAFAAALDQSARARHARKQDAEWVRQLNMSFAEPGSAAWEIDFVERRLIGADKLSALIGRAVSFEDVLEAAFAAPADRQLVKAAFSPARGATRRIALEHQVRSGPRVRHQGFIRTTPDGAPVRLTCVTRLSETPAQQAPASAAAALEAAIAAQAQILKTLSNELSTALDTAPAPTGDFAQKLAALAAREDIVDRGVDALAHARHAAESANLAKSQFLANMSHELRTPLNAVIGYAEMLQEDAEDKSDDAAVQDLNRILAAAKHLLMLLNEILDLSKIEAGRMDVAPAPFNPLEVLDDLLETVRPLAEQNGNAIAIVGPRPEGEANTDAMKLRQCVLNLLSNSCKFTKNGAIEISYARAVRNGHEHLVIAVRDTGIGMSDEQMTRLFQPFVQADPSITQQYGGTGLGLTITARLTQLMGGEVSVDSALGQGATFTLVIPADYPAYSRSDAAEIDVLQGAEGAPLVLVIEDEPDARELAARALTRAGFSVLGVGGGEAGLALARVKSPALVLLDIFLPDRSGWRVLQSLKHDPKTQDIPVVVLSVNEDRAHAMALGAAEHMVKPADRDKLAATVMRYARKRPTGQEQAAAAAPVTRLSQKQAG